MFDEDFRRDNGEAHAKKIITIMCKFDTAMTKTLELLRKLLERQPPIRVVVPPTPGSPLVIVEALRETSAEPGLAEFKCPNFIEREMIRSA